MAVQWGVFVLFACCVFLMTLSVYLFFPETKGVPIEDCPYVFKKHWYWKKWVPSAGFLCLSCTDH